MVKIESYKSGNQVKHLDFKAFSPNPIHTQYQWEDRELTRLSEQAALALGQLDAYGELVPDIDHFIRMYVTKEATLSSRIEGTQTNMDDALLAEQDIQPERREDWREVQNYMTAMNHALQSLDALPISSRLLCQVHKILLDGVRGANKLPGEFRRSQNWIGGQSIRTAAFIPPLQDDINRLMGDLEKFLHEDDTGLTEIMKIALAHYQFETIHPFLDGNGRIGRLLITLYLVEKGVLHKPVLYLSAYFERNRLDYYDHLMRVRTHHDLARWMKFFMKGIIETAQSSVQSLKDILVLKKDCEENRIYHLGKKVGVAKKLLDYLFREPMVDAGKVAAATSLSLVSTYKLIEDFTRLGILKERTGYKRNRIFTFEEYVDIFR
jgi:Fic family protein